MDSPKNTSPVGWYVGSYLIRFIELEAKGNDDPEAEFLAWENTVLVKAGSMDEAYAKIEKIANEASHPYKGGEEGTPVQWVFEGITQLLPIYEPLEDGAEIMWQEHEPTKLRDLKEWPRSLKELKQ